MFRRTVFSFMILLIILPLSVFASSLEAGAIFMMIFPGSRATSMGGAFTASDGDIFSTYYNDATLAFVENKQIGWQHANWLPGLYPGMYYEYLTFLIPLGEGLNLDFAVTYLTTGETEVSDSLRDFYEEWVTYDIAFKAGGCLKLSENLGVGIGMKYIRSFLAPEIVLRDYLGLSGAGGTGQAWALDVSLLYIWNDFINAKLFGMEWLKTVRIGASLQNFGPDISYVENGESDPLPRTLRLGLSFGLLEEETHKLNLNMDLIKILIGVEYTDFQEIWRDSWKAMGIEYTLNNLFSLRLGYFLDRVGQREGPTFGAGFQYQKFHFDLSVDQEIYDFETANYRISAQLSF
ncbi:PorV/PorQ family protein [candidate division WOR-3 bacterium]|nr:PorV/PorQ family protein [candidate division WOR-3 bacterium]